MSHGVPVKVIYCGTPLSRRQQALRKRIEGSILRTAAVDGAAISEDDVRRRIYMEEARKKTYILSKPLLNIIQKYVWDIGLRGPSDKRTIEQLYRECQLGATAIGKRDKISTKVTNVYRTYRETKEIFEDRWVGVDLLASRISKLLSCFKEREGAQKALEVYGVTVRQRGCCN